MSEIETATYRTHYTDANPKIISRNALPFLLAKYLTVGSSVWLVDSGSVDYDLITAARSALLTCKFVIKVLRFQLFYSSYGFNKSLFN